MSTFSAIFNLRNLLYLIYLVAAGADKSQKPLEIRAFGQKESTATLIPIVSKLRCFFGGGEGSRTPVRKPVHMVFSERSRWLEFPGTVAHRQTAMSGSFFGHDLFKSKREVHVHRFLTFHTRPRSSGGNGWHTATAQPLGCQCYFLIVSVYFLLGLFESLPGLCSLTILQDPRRNLYAPISLYFDI